MTAPAVARAGPTARAWETWSGLRTARISRALLLAGMALLFLHAAATVDVGFTLRVSYVLLVAACAVGLPYVIRGALAAPEPVRWLAVSLVAAYLVAWGVGVDDVVATTRGGSIRGAVYVFDLVLGLGVAALVVGLSRAVPVLRPAVWALLAGAVAAALYGIYEWLALELDLPLASITNALNTDGVTRGAQSQGGGIFGAERSRGTFVEPHFLAAYLATMLPLAIALDGPHRRRLGLAAAVPILVAIVLTSSAPAWMDLALAAAAAGCAWAVATGRVLPAAALASLLLAMVLGGSMLLTDPAPLARVTGRDEAHIDVTVRFRTDNWEEAIAAWGARPALGYGPGQSAVQLSPARKADPLSPRDPTILGSAQGLWAAALVDTGVVGLGLWALLLAAVVTASWRLVLRRPSRLHVALLLALTAGLVAAQMSGDRLELRVWALVGLVLAAAAARGHGGRDPGERDEQPGAEAGERPEHRGPAVLAHEAGR